MARLRVAVGLCALALLSAPGGAVAQVNPHVTATSPVDASPPVNVLPQPADTAPQLIGWPEIHAELEVSEQQQLRVLRGAMSPTESHAFLLWASHLELGARGQMIGRLLAAPLNQQQAFIRFLPLLTAKELSVLVWRSDEIRRRTFEFVLRYVARTPAQEAREMLFDEAYLKPIQSPGFVDLPPAEQRRLIAATEEFLEFWEQLARATHAQLAPPFTSRWQAQLFKAGASASPFKPIEVRRERENFGVTLRDFERWHECGGVLIAPRWVLTAAHCIKQPRMGPFIENRRVRTGTHSLVEGGTTWRIAAVVRHAGYDPDRKINDIALLQIAPDGLTRQRDNRQARIARLPEPGDPPVRIGETLSLTGWGVTGDTALGSKFRDLEGLPKRPTPDLMVAEVKLVPAQVCNSHALYRQTGSKVGRGQFCALGDDQQDACQGDSGGPLVRKANGRQVVIGLVSYGMGCGLRDTPGVYIDIRSYLGWIRQAMSRAKPNQVIDWAPSAAR